MTNDFRELFVKRQPATLRGQASKDVLELASGRFRGFARYPAIAFENDRRWDQLRKLTPAFVAPLRVGTPRLIANPVCAPGAAVGDAEREVRPRHDLLDCDRAC